MRAAATPVWERIAIAEDQLAEAGADVVVLDVGRVIRQPAFPHVYDANLVRRARLRLDTLDDALERLAAPLRAVGARHLQLSGDGADLPEEIGAALGRRGFLPDRLLAMTLVGKLARPASPSVRLRAVPREVAWDGFGFAMDRMNREEPWYAPAVSREIIGSMRHKAEAGALSLFVAELDGRIAGSVGMALHRGCGSVVSVGTLPDMRGRGVGTSMVSGIVDRLRAAGADIVYLIARADDTPKDLYRTLGFAVERGFDIWLRLPR
jgi:GNAT superfamily N-acetyltransferase